MNAPHAFFGGAFDPPHQAHVALAQAAVQQLDLACLHIVPTGMAWHKTRQLSPPEHRLTMTRLAFADVPKTRIETLELEQSGPSYTVDTVHTLQRAHPEATRWWVVIGQDQAERLHTWHQIEQLCRAVTWAIALRSECGAASAAQAALDVIAAVQARLPEAQCVSIHMPAHDISSTRLRQQLAQTGTAPLEHLPTAVAAYIQTHQLYRT